MQVADDLELLIPEEMSKEQDAHNRRTYRLAVAALIISTGLGVGNFVYQAYRDYHTQKSTQTRFGNIETVLRLLTGAVAPQLQKAVDDSLAGALVGNDSNKTTNQIEYAGTIIHQLTESKVSLPSAAIETTRQHLEQLVDTKADITATWSTAGKFISYRSQLLKDWQASQLPPCTNQAAAGKGTLKGDQFTHGPLEYHYCKIILDSLETTASLSPQLAIADMVFDHCDVFYNGGQIVIIPMAVGTHPNPPRIGTIYFRDCLFILSIVSTPSPQGEQLVRTLLAASSNTVQFQASQS